VYPECSELHKCGHGQSTTLHEFIANEGIKRPTLSRRTLLWVTISGTIYPRRQTTNRWKKL